MTEKKTNLIDVGRVSGIFGIKGWIKVKSSTEPPENIFGYTPWWVKTKYGVKAVEVDECRQHGADFVAHIKGVDDRDAAEVYSLANIAIERCQLEALDNGDYYWDQLIGLEVISVFGDGEGCVLGRIKSLLETGANDVLVVAATDKSLDDRERLVPYVPDLYVKSVDLQTGQMIVEWDPSF